MANHLPSPGNTANRLTTRKPTGETSDLNPNFSFAGQPSSDRFLQGKTAIITGAAKGIGAAAARRFAAEGARIVLADKDEANGQLDIVVNNAGWQLNKTLLETTAEEFNAVLNTNLTSMFLFTKGAANVFIAQKTGGASVNVCSTFAVVGSPGYAAYHASKGGVASFTRAAAISLMPHNIRVNAVGPGTTETPRLHDGAKDTGDEAKGMAGFLALQPLKRFGKPEEIASVIAFLASDEASFVTGALWMADGGYTIV